tara:strand:- start:421 stop:1041 length:621 start_codon:yes stop_codon:yes gene_type:complete
MLTLDHIVISSESLAIGQAFIENKLGIRADTGGEHKLFGTHNKLISLGDTYLEVIAVSPDLIPETTPRWFNLDHFNGPPIITNWVCGANFGEFAPSDLMNGMGDILNLSRGSLKWKITVPKDGKLPYEGAVPALIDWGDSKHPTDTLKESGCRMTKFRIKHKFAANLRSSLSGLLSDQRIEFVCTSGAGSYELWIETPQKGTVIIK